VPFDAEPKESWPLAVTAISFLQSSTEVLNRGAIDDKPGT
jgi:hypothetical protein